MSKKISYYLFFGVGGILLVVAIASFFSINTELNLVFLVNYESSKDFFKYYEFPIKFLVGAIASLSLGVTMLRAYQFDKNIIIVEDNYKFNNYYKHREEFNKRFQDETFLKTISELKSLSIDTYFIPLYNIFYYQSYHNFKPTINKEAKDQIENFLKAIEESDINNVDYDLIKIDKNILVNISEKNNSFLRGLTITINSRESPKFRQQLKQLNVADKDIGPATTKFIYFNEFFWSISFYNSLNTFDGAMVVRCENFLINYENYRSGLSF